MKSIFLILRINYSHYLDIREMDFNVFIIACNFSLRTAIVREVL